MRSPTSSQQNSKDTNRLHGASLALPEGEHPVLRVALSYTDALHNLAHTTLEVTAKLAAILGAAEPQEPNFDVIKTVELIQPRTKAPKPWTGMITRRPAQYWKIA
jgi:hypothetical protein